MNAEDEEKLFQTISWRQLRRVKSIGSTPERSPC